MLAMVMSEEIHDLEECDSYDGTFEDEEEEIPEDDPDEDGDLLEEEEVVLVEDAVIVPNMEDDIDYNDHKYLLNELDSYHQERHKRLKIPWNMEAAVVLLSDLQKSNVSLVAYKKIIKWTDQFFIFNDADETKPPSWARVIKYLSKRYKLECLKPQKTRCCLPTTNLVFDLITHWLLSSIFSLFTDETLMKLGNLIFKNAREPCKLRKDRGIIGEIDSASAYWEFCKNAPEDAIVMPMIIKNNSLFIVLSLSLEG